MVPTTSTTLITTTVHTNTMILGLSPPEFTALTTSVGLLLGVLLLSLICYIRRRQQLFNSRHKRLLKAESSCQSTSCGPTIARNELSTVIVTGSKQEEDGVSYPTERIHHRTSYHNHTMVGELSAPVCNDIRNSNPPAAAARLSGSVSAETVRQRDGIDEACRCNTTLDQLHQSVPELSMSVVALRCDMTRDLGEFGIGLSQSVSSVESDGGLPRTYSYQPAYSGYRADQYGYCPPSPGDGDVSVVEVLYWEHSDTDHPAAECRTSGVDATPPQHSSPPSSPDTVAPHCRYNLFGIISPKRTPMGSNSYARMCERRRPAALPGLGRLRQRMSLDTDTDTDDESWNTPLPQHQPLWFTGPGCGVPEDGEATRREDLTQPLLELHGDEGAHTRWRSLPGQLAEVARGHWRLQRTPPLPSTDSSCSTLRGGSSSGSSGGSGTEIKFTYLLEDDEDTIVRTTDITPV